MTGDWRDRTELVTDGDPRILGEDERGYLWVPSRTKPDYWDRPLSLLRPTHWPYWLRSRITRRIAHIETDVAS
jgi:hypothetical protein